MSIAKPLTPTDNSKNTLLYASFNQDLACFSIAYESGFRVYNTDPMELNVKREFESSSSANSGTTGLQSNNGGIGVAQMLHRTNYLALVGGGRRPKFPQNKVIIWDDLKRKPALSLEFLSPVINVLLSRTHIVVILNSNVHVYAFSSPPTKIAAYETVDNPNGLGVMAGNILAFPSRVEGQIQIITLEGTAGHEASTSGSNSKALVTIVRAHKSPIRCLALNSNGSVLASASEMGTIIRLHSTHSTALLHEFRRGLDRAVIYSMAFSPSSTRLAVLSDKNTLHVFDTQTLSTTNRRHLLGKVPFMPRYFSSEWSFASCRVDNQKGILGWSSDDSVIVVWITNCKWEKYVIVEREDSVQTGLGSQQNETWELIREAWRGFEGLSSD